MRRGAGMKKYLLIFVFLVVLFLNGCAGSGATGDNQGFGSGFFLGLNFTLYYGGIFIGVIVGVIVLALIVGAIIWYFC